GGVFTEERSPEALAGLAEATALTLGEADPFAAELGAQDTVLLGQDGALGDEILDQGSLALREQAGEGEKEEAERMGHASDVALKGLSSQRDPRDPRPGHRSPLPERGRGAVPCLARGATSHDSSGKNLLPQP